MRRITGTHGRWWLSLLTIGCLSLPAFADSVTTTNGIVMKGEILRNDDRGILFKHEFGREILVPHGDIKTLDAGFSPSYAKGTESFKEADYPEAIQQFQSALSKEKRDWARSWILTDVISAQIEIGDWQAAANSFAELPLTADDGTRLAAAPLIWTPMTLRDADIKWARENVRRSDTITRLIAASWLLCSDEPSYTQPAEEALEDLLQSQSDVVAAIANAQRWRSPEATVNSSERLAVLERLPNRLRGGALAAQAQALSREGKKGDGALAATQAGLVMPGRPSQQAESLWLAARLAGESGMENDAAKLLQLLVKRYPNTVAGKQAKKQLAALRDSKVGQ